MAYETKTAYKTALRFILREVKVARNEETLAALRRVYEDIQDIASVDDTNIPPFDKAVKEQNNG
jgi:uncharacterized protein (DUF111 family)